MKKDIFNKIADRSVLMKREARRRAVQEKVQRINTRWAIKAPFLELMRGKPDSAVWSRAAGACVGCGACTHICPDCYCFFIEEAKLKNQDAYAKYRYWDSCQYAGFSKMAENVNPRKDIQRRFKYRYLHKFDYIRENFGFDGCTGCGRCIQACCGNIDMRNVLSELSREKKISLMVKGSDA